MWLLSFFLGNESKLQRAAEAIAAECHEAVWERIQHRMPQLTSAEARGYIRARAASVVSDEVARLIADTRSRVNQPRLVELAMQSVIRRMLLEAKTIHQQAGRRVRRAA